VAKPVKVYMALIVHRHGEDMLAGGTKEELRHRIYCYVLQSWSEWMGDRPIPKSEKAAISQYFDVTKEDAHRGEFLTYAEDKITLPEGTA